MATTNGVTFDISPPGRLQKPHVYLRVVALIIVYLLPTSLSWLLYLGIPGLAAILVSQRGGERFVAEDGPRLVRWGRYLLAALAYILFATDRLPYEDPEQTLQFQVQPSGTPTVGSALLRVIFIIPHLVVLALLGLAYLVLWPAAAVFILLRESYPEPIFAFTRSYLRWSSRVLAYHASLVEAYPPFSF